MIGKKQSSVDKIIKSNIENAELNIDGRSRLATPSTLTKEAKKEWIRLRKLYEQMHTNILLDLDIATLTVYCEAVSMYKEAQKQWKLYNCNVISNDKETQIILNELRKILKEQSEIINKTAIVLGLNPAGRAKMGFQKVEKQPADPLEKLIAKYGE